LVDSTIAKGKIISINTTEAERSPGVVAVLTHLNRPNVPGWETKGGQQGESRVEGQEFRVFYDNTIHFDRQPIALVIADTFERATHAASLVKATYQKEEANTNIKNNLSKAVTARQVQDYNRGDENAWETAPVKIEAKYTTPFQVHNPMEMHAATIVWEATDKVVVYNKTQATKIAQQDIMKAFHLKEENVVVHSPFVGGAFGSSSRVWPEEMAALLGAKKIGKPVKVMLRRDQAFNMVGYRPTSIQKISIGAEKDGTLVGIHHEAFGSTSQYEKFTERIIDPTKALYNCPNVSTTYRLVQLDMSTPCWTRGPGETSGSFALESAIDELSYQLKMDPLELRLKNFAEKDPEKNKPWSSNYLRECYQLGAEKFGWKNRSPLPHSTKKDGWLLGMGMAAGIYHASRSPATASATLRNDGTLLVQTSVADTGPGSATIMAKIAADAMSIDVSKVEFQWGHSTLPPAPGEFGSHTTASTGSGVHDAVKALQKKLASMMADNQDSSFSGSSADDFIFEKEMIRLKTKDVSLSYKDALKELSLDEVKAEFESKPSEEIQEYSGYSFAAHFVEVLVNPDTGVVKVNRVVSAVDAGRVVNKKTATNQVYGSVAWGIGIALMEEGILDHRYGRYVNNDLANYHVPVNADIPNVEVIFPDKPDPILDPMGAKGLGEIGLVGFSAAIANAVYHATGKRIRELPITVDKLIS
jgi:xanthine dehydrogenase YagR molybdenum-binding subunit